MTDKQSRAVPFSVRAITISPFNVTRADLIAYARSNWVEHDPGDEDEPSWLTAPAAPDSPFMRDFRRQVLGEWDREFLGPWAK